MGNYKKTNWKKEKLRDICSDITIGLVKTMTKSYTEDPDGVPLIRNSDIKENKIRKNGLIRLEKDFAEENKGKKLQLGDIVTVHTGDIGTSAVIDEELHGSHGFATLNTRVNKEIIDEYYLCYYFNSSYFKNQAYSLSTGDGRNNLNLKDFIKTVILFPENKKEQKKIVEYLTTIDSVIEKTEAIINQTEKVKKGLMQQLLTKGIGHSKFKKTEIGEIPAVWEVKDLDSMFEFYGGMPFSRASLGEQGPYYLHYGDIHKIDKKVFDTTVDSSWLPRLAIEEGRIRENSLLKTGDIVFADASEDTDGIGKSVVIKNDENKVFISGLHTIIAKDKLPMLDINYKQYCFNNYAVRKQFIKIATGATVYGISKSNIKQIYIPIPPLEEQKKIGAILQSLDDKIQHEYKKLIPLNETKKGIMQVLLTGVVRVKLNSEEVITS